MSMIASPVRGAPPGSESAEAPQAPRTPEIKVTPRRTIVMPVGKRPNELATTAAYTVAGFALLLLLWALAARIAGRDLPGPDRTLQVLGRLLSDPFFDKGPNNKGIGLQFMISLGRVFTGFGLGALVAIPLGCLMGASPRSRRLLYPIVQVLRPVSPLAWFPIGLAAFQSAQTATVFVLFITSLWPTLINTAFGVMSLPDDHRNVARVFEFSRWRYLSRVLLPFALPHILTGMRLSMGVAWMVIVAAEMLAGGTGVGFFVWDSWNALSLERVLSAILLIGGVGLVLDRAFDWVGQRFSYS